jgi:hypothetical protein
MITAKQKTPLRFYKKALSVNCVGHFFKIFQLVYANTPSPTLPVGRGKLNAATLGKAGGLLGEPLIEADKTMSSLNAADFLLLPPCRGKVGMGVEISVEFLPPPQP